MEIFLIIGSSSINLRVSKGWMAKVLVRASAKIDDSACTSLGEFLSCLSAQLQSKISFGIGFEVCVKVIQIYTRFIFCCYIIHQEDEVSPSSSALSRSARDETATSHSEHGSNTSPISSYRSRESYRPQHSHSWKTDRSSVESKRSTSSLSVYDSRERQHSQVSQRSRSRSPCASPVGHVKLLVRICLGK